MYKLLLDKEEIELLARDVYFDYLNIKANTTKEIYKEKYPILRNIIRKIELVHDISEIKKEMKKI